MSKRWRPEDIKAAVRETESHFFDRDTMRCFGDTMKNFGVRVEKDGVIYLYRKKPVKHGLLGEWIFDPELRTLKKVQKETDVVVEESGGQTCGYDWWGLGSLAKADELLALASKLTAEELRSRIDAVQTFVASTEGVKQLKLDDVEWTLEVEMDDTPVRGNAQASGDKDYDRDVENRILERLGVGDVWAWAHVRVVGRYQDFTADDGLGCCSYESEKDFVKHSCYYDDMRQEVLAQLQKYVDADAGVHNTEGA